MSDVVLGGSRCSTNLWGHPTLEGQDTITQNCTMWAFQKLIFKVSGYLLNK